MTDNVAFGDLPADAFPFTIEFFRHDTGEVVHTIHVPGPGAIAVPALAADVGVKIDVRIISPQGVQEHRAE